MLHIFSPIVFETDLGHDHTLDKEQAFVSFEKKKGGVSKPQSSNDGMCDS